MTPDEIWQTELRDAQAILMTLGFSVIDVLPDVISSVLRALTESQVFRLATNLYENCQGRKDPVTNATLLFPFGKDIVVASYLQQYESETTDDADKSAAAEADTLNACVRASNLLEFLEKQKRLDKSGPFGNKEEQYAGDIQPGLQGLRQIVIAWAFGCPAPLDVRVVDEARPHIRNNDEVSCNKLLSRLSVGKHGPAFALSLLGSCGMSKSLFLRRFKAAHEQTPTNLYRALFRQGILGPVFYQDHDDDIVSAARDLTKGISPLLYYAQELERKILGDC
jgi:hypothetical protein